MRLQNAADWQLFLEEKHLTAVVKIRLAREEKELTE
jgi:hypothetical protein